jgi:hypothetical protein
MPSLVRVVIEIDVRVKLLAWPVLVRAATDVHTVVEQVGDAREVAEKRRKFCGLEKVVGKCVRTAKRSNILDSRFPAGQATLVEIISAFERRKLSDQSLAKRRCEKLIDGKMWKGIGRSEVTCVPCTIFQDLRIN